MGHVFFQTRGKKHPKFIFKCLFCYLCNLSASLDFNLQNIFIKAVFFVHVTLLPEMSSTYTLNFPVCYILVKDNPDFDILKSVLS